MKLYRYYSASKGIAAITHSRLCLTPPEFFNDPFEFAPASARDLTDQEIAAHIKTRHHRDIVRQALTELGEYSGTKRVFPKWLVTNFDTLFPILKNRFRGAAAEIESTFTKIVSRHFVVCCFSGSPDNLLMWSHYAESHGGMVVAYEINAKLFPNGTFAQVTYSADRVTVEPLFFAATAPYDKSIMRTMLTKSIDWEYEHEYRVVLPIKDCISEQHPNGTYYYLDLLLSSTSEVIVGARCSDATIAAVREACRQYPNVITKKASLSKKRFAIDFGPME
jgi:hypothetical protein